MLVLNNQISINLSSAAHVESKEWKDLYLNRAIKLGRLYNETLEALNRYRRKGEQRVTVQHHHNQQVNVSDGGKAVVTGQMTGGGSGDKDKK
jgi:hypothetical protein